MELSQTLKLCQRWRNRGIHHPEQLITVPPSEFHLRPFEPLDSPIIHKRAVRFAAVGASLTKNKATEQNL